MKILLSALLSTLLFADFTMIYEMDNGIEGKFDEIIQYKDENHIKLSYRDANGNGTISKTGQYIIDGVRYTVLREDGRLTYMDMDKIDQEMSLLSKELNVTNESNISTQYKKNFFTIIKRGEPKDYNGIIGEVWDVESQEDGVKFTEQITVTNDKEVVKAMQISMRILDIFGEGPYGIEIDHKLITMMLPSPNYALLYAKGMNYKSLSYEDINSSIFKLPKGAVDSMECISEEAPQSQETVDADLSDANKTLGGGLLDTNQSTDNSIEHIEISDEEMFVKHKEFLPQKLSQMQDARVCLENAFKLEEANSCFDGLVAVESKMDSKQAKDRVITKWNKPYDSVTKDALDEEILDIKRRMPCIRRSQNLDDLSKCLQVLPIE